MYCLYHGYGVIPIKMACAELWGSFTLHRDRSHLFGSLSIISVLVSASVSVIISVNTPLKCKLNNLQLLALSSIGAYSDIWGLGCIAHEMYRGTRVHNNLRHCDLSSQRNEVSSLWFNCKRAVAKSYYLIGLRKALLYGTVRWQRYVMDTPACNVSSVLMLN